MSDRSFRDLVQDLERLEAITTDWESNQKSTVQAMRQTIEEIQAGAFRQMIRAVKEHPGGLDALMEALEDEWVLGVLSYHGIIRGSGEDMGPTLEQRIEQAIDEVRPALLGHDGDVEIVSITPPEVKIRLLGSCDGCVFSEATVKLGIERAVKNAADEIERVVVVKGMAPAKSKTPESSPFDRPWFDVCTPEDIPDGGVHSIELPKVSLLLTRDGERVKAYPNACPHLGMPLDDGEIHEGVLTCRYHGFQFQLNSGECLTAPEIGLPTYPVRVEHGRVKVQVTQ
ncbi:MAG: NifU family protein [Myxococcota bacterium]